MNKDGLVVLALVLSAVVMVGVGYATSGTPPDEEWNRTFGGTEYDAANSVQQTSDGGYIIAGSTESYGDGFADFWLIKLEKESIEVKEEITTPEAPTEEDTGMLKNDSELTIPESPAEEDEGTPGFGTMFAVAGLLAVVYLLRKKK